ncbi:MAG: AAA family ATPase [Sulfurimonadaceae bacterium]|jgi:5-methylcytosine-specific restriction protein B|nr:AAA family ATPase [Sulfurimonadaceae bacterium]
MLDENDFYALGSTWEDTDKTDEFVEKGIWENGFDDGSNENIVNQIKVGDYIALKSSYTKTKNLPFDNQNKSVSVMKIKAIGRVIENPQDGKVLKILYDRDFQQKELYGFSYRRTVSIINKEKWPEEIQWIFFNKKQSHYYSFSKKDNSHFVTIKNIILYGAPGVGKTHNYRNLIAMIEEGKNQKEIFDTISSNSHIELNNETFETIKNEKRVEFVTFHQSYSYEDFIEGFRPNESGNIERKDGIFKSISDNAKKNLKDSLKQIETIEEEKKFNELFELFQDYIQDEIDKNNKFDINETAYITNIEDNAFRYQGDNWGNTQRMKFSDIELLYSLNISERKEIKNLENISGLAKQHATYFSYFMKKFLDFKNKQKIEIKDVNTVKQKNFYIVIDEINRGNISKIFGELITLIEEDKRDIYEVTLPYSKEKFSIPSNLYIIATMNSTDKSIATIDIALRRRFTFLKMKPNQDLVLHVEAKNLLNKLNIFIKETLGEDYMLGHSYFMKIENDEDLEFVKEYKIKPLLEEYFYADENNHEKALVILKEKSIYDKA